MRRGPTDDEWRRLGVAFGLFFGATLAVAAFFVTASPFPRAVGIVLLAPPVVVTGWIWFGVVLRRDAEQLQRITAFAARRRRRRR